MADEPRTTAPSPGSSADGSPARRRDRSGRVTAAAALLAAATLVVALALATRSSSWLAGAGVLAVALGWAALRTLWTDVLDERQAHARDRAAAAAAYRAATVARTAEHEEFTAAMTERLAEAHLSRRELEGRLAQAERRAVRAETRLAAEAPGGVDVLEWEQRNGGRAKQPRKRTSA